MPEPGEMLTMGTETTTETPSKTKRRAKIRFQDAAAVVELVAKGCSEPESCKALNIRHQTWQNWKLKPKNQRIFEDCLHEEKARIIQTCVNGIEKAGLKDWRALRERLALLDRDRFSDRAPAQPVTVQVGIFANSDLDALGARVYSQPRQVQGKDVKQIQDKVLPKE